MTDPSALKEYHALAQQLAVRGGCDGIVVLTCNHKAVIAKYPNSALIILLQVPGLGLSDAEKRKLPPNVVTLALKDADRELLKNKVFICTEYLEVCGSGLKRRDARTIASVASKSALSIVAVKKVGGWSDKSFKKIFKYNKSIFFGEYKNKDLVAIGGRLANMRLGRSKLVPVLAIVSQFNEVDIIEPVIMHLLNQGVDVHVIDNWSDDGSYEAVEAIASRYTGRVSIERFPDTNTGKYEWSGILKRVTDVARERPRYKWIISNDADEIRWSPWPGTSLQKAISFIDRCGFNVIDYTVFNFSPTKDGYSRGLDPLKFFRFGDFGHEGWHFMQLKTWRNHPDADIASSGGHLIKLPEAKIFPLKFFLWHYSLRSNTQAWKKVFQDRKPRFRAEEASQGWHSHYDKIAAKQDFIKNQKGLLNLADEEKFFAFYMLERLTGTGIKINKIK